VLCIPRASGSRFRTPTPTAAWLSPRRRHTGNFDVAGGKQLQEACNKEPR
jgi:hypothetical protein